MVPHTRDGRVMFAIPWHGHTRGRDDRHADRRTDAGAAAAGERDRVHPRDGGARICTRRPTRADVLSVFAGIRPLVRTGGQPDHRGAVARPHDPHRRVGAADDGGRQVDDLPAHGRGRGGPGDRVRDDCLSAHASRANCASTDSSSRGATGPLSLYGSDADAIRRARSGRSVAGHRARLRPAVHRVAGRLGRARGICAEC